MGALLNPYRFAAAAPAANPPVLVFYDGWPTLASSGAVQYCTFTSTGGLVNGRYTSPNSAAAQITGSGGRNLVIAPPGMTGDWMILGFNGKWVAEGQAFILAINRGATGTIGQDANTCARFRAETNGDLTVLDSNGTVVGTLPTVLNHPTWHWLDIKLQALNAGKISVWLDGTLVLDNVSGDFAGASATGNTWGVIFTDDQDSGSDNTGSTRIGECLIGTGDATTDRWGEHRGYVLTPDGVASAGGWTANTGTLATAMDEFAHNADSDYGTTAVANDEFLLTYLTQAGLSNIAAVKLLNVLRSVTGTPSLQQVIKPGTQAAIYGASNTVSTSYGSRGGLMLQNNPNTGLPWTQAEIDDLQAGIKFIGPADSIRVTTCILQVAVKL